MGRQLVCRETSRCLARPSGSTNRVLKPSVQRGKNVALDPSSLDLRLGHPRFLTQITPKLFKMRVLGPLD